MEEMIKLITPLVTILVVILLGQLSKKYEFVNKNLLPIQNNIIAIIIAVIEYAITKDFNYITVASGLLASGVYDVFHGTNKDKIEKHVAFIDDLDMESEEQDVIEEVIDEVE